MAYFRCNGEKAGNSIGTAYIVALGSQVQKSINVKGILPKSNNYKFAIMTEKLSAGGSNTVGASPSYDGHRASVSSSFTLPTITYDPDQEIVTMSQTKISGGGQGSGSGNGSCNAYTSYSADIIAVLAYTTK